MGKSDRTKAVLDRALKELAGLAEPATSAVRGLLGGAIALIDAEAAAVVVTNTPAVPPTPAAVPTPPVAVGGPAAVLPVPTLPPRIWNSVEERRRKLQESPSPDRGKVESANPGR